MNNKSKFGVSKVSTMKLIDKVTGEVIEEKIIPTDQVGNIMEQIIYGKEKAAEQPNETTISIKYKGEKPMSKLECDLQILALVKNFLRTTDKTIYDYIPEYDAEKINEISIKQKMLESEEMALKTLSKLVNQTYNRILKKTT
jgi:hypothetical protein